MIRVWGSVTGMDLKPSAIPVVYTSVFGGFEKIWSPILPSQHLHYFAVTDGKNHSRGWEHVGRNLDDFAGSRLANRHQKMLFHESLPASPASLYVDANVRPIASLTPLFEAFAASGADLAMYPHYARETVASEAEACIARKKVENPQTVREELAFYNKQGFPDEEGMWEGSVIFKNHSSPRLSDAMHEWWETYSRFRTRDQFSLPYIVWKHDLRVFNLDQHSPGREHYFVRLQHSTAGLSNKVGRYLQARAPENSFWKGLHALGKKRGSTSA